MSDPSSTSALLTLLGTINATFSRALADGASRCDSQDGTTTGKCSREAVRANLSAPPEKEGCTPTIGASSEPARKTPSSTTATSGPRSPDSSRLGSLQRFLASRLESALASTGSPLYAQTWKTLAMPAGEPICRLAASGRRTFDSGSFGSELPVGWLTATVEDADRDGSLLDWMQYAEHGQTSGARLRAQVHAAGWPTPLVNDTTGSGYCNGPNGERYLKLPGAAAMSGWPSPRASSSSAGPTRGWSRPAICWWRQCPSCCPGR